MSLTPTLTLVCMLKLVLVKMMIQLELMLTTFASLLLDVNIY